MKIFQFGLLTILVVMLLNVTAWGQGKPATEEQMIRQTDVGMVRLEEGLKNLEKRFDDMNKRIDDLRTDIVEMRSTMVTGFGVLLSGMFALFGFVLWDRRTAIAPIARTTKELEEKEEKIIAVLRAYAKENKKFLEIMKQSGIL